MWWFNQPKLVSYVTTNLLNVSRCDMEPFKEQDQEDDNHAVLDEVWFYVESKGSAQSKMEDIL